jgi:large subunit ribosomal protein L33
VAPRLARAARPAGLTCQARALSCPAQCAEYQSSIIWVYDLQLIKMVSTADTGYFYVARKNSRTMTEKLQLRKYDPRARKHVIFKESKMK